MKIPDYILKVIVYAMLLFGILAAMYYMGKGGLRSASEPPSAKADGFGFT